MWIIHLCWINHSTKYNYLGELYNETERMIKFNILEGSIWIHCTLLDGLIQVTTLASVYTCDFTVHSCVNYLLIFHWPQLRFTWQWEKLTYWNSYGLASETKAKIIEALNTWQHYEQSFQGKLPSNHIHNIFESENQ